jgi:osmotically-inducible protein OsmY
MGGYQEDRERDYGQAHAVYLRGNAWDEDNVRYGNQYGAERGGYPDYSGSQGRAGREGEYNYASQDRGNMNAPVDRDWGQYGRAGYRERDERQGSGYAGERYAGGYGTHEGYGQGDSYGSQGGFYGGQGGSYGGQGGSYRGQGGSYGGQSGSYGGQGGYGSNEAQTGYGTSRGQQRGSTGYGQREYGGRQGGSMQTARRQGPKGYQRSDERLREQVIDQFMDHTDDDVNLQEIEVDVKDGVVILSGTVDCRSCRHELEDIADSVWGVKEVTNNLRVRSGSDHPGSTTSSSQGNTGTGSERSTSTTSGTSGIGSTTSRNR